MVTQVFAGGGCCVGAKNTKWATSWAGQEPRVPGLAPEFHGTGAGRLPGATAKAAVLWGGEVWGPRRGTKARRMLVKAGHTDKGGNPRFVVTNLEGEAQKLYDELYCARGEMENRVQEQPLGLFADRTSCHGWWANQIPAAAVQLRVCAVGTIAGAGVGGHGTGAGTSEYHPAEALENRRGGLGATPGGFGCF